MGPNSFGLDQKQLVSTEFCFQTHAQNNLDISITNLQRSKSFWIYRRTIFQGLAFLQSKWFTVCPFFIVIKNVSTGWIFGATSVKAGKICSPWFENALVTPVDTYLVIGWTYKKFCQKAGKIEMVSIWNQFSDKQVSRVSFFSVNHKKRIPKIKRLLFSGYIHSSQAYLAIDIYPWLYRS